MAFVFTVETGSGTDSAANSYVSVEDADDILTTNIHVSAKWDALTVDQKERLLVWSTRFLDERTRWKGTKTVEDSPLRWPRTGVCDRDSVVLAGDSIPTQLKIAATEMARYLIDQDRTTERDTDGLERVKADVVEIEFLAGYRLPQVPSNIQYLIQGLGYIGGGNGSRFVPITR